MSNRGDLVLFAGSSGLEYTTRVIHALNGIVKNRHEILSDIKNKNYQQLKEIRSVDRLLEMGSLEQGKIDIIDFGGDSETNTNILQNIRGQDVFFIQQLFDPKKEFSTPRNLVESLISADAFRRSKAKHVTGVFPYYSYARQDKQHGRDAVTSALMPRLYATAGFDSIMTMDLHADQIVGSFDPTKIQIEHLHSSPLLINYIRSLISLNKIDKNKLKVAAPDAGAAKVVEYYAKNLQCELVYASKNRSYKFTNKIDNMQILGDVKDATIVLIDDQVKSAGTLYNIIVKMLEEGAESIYGVCTHPLLTGEATTRFQKLFDESEGKFKGLIGSDTVLHPSEYINERPWFDVVSTAEYMALAIYEIHTEGSINMLYNPNSKKLQQLVVNNFNKK